MRIVLVGFGNMGRALATGWLEAESTGREITVIDPDADARARAGSFGMKTAESIRAFDEPVDIVVLAVKPADIDAVLAELPPAGLIISIAAGRTISEIESVVGEGSAVIRAMPNLPAAIGLGVTGLSANSAVKESDREAAEALLGAVGSVEWLDDEAGMDALTAVSGSGPAYVFLLIECLTEAAVDAGLDRRLAERLATATVSGAASYAHQADEDAAELRRQVTSPNGTTAAALDVLLENGALEDLIRRAVAAAAKRSRELSS